MGAEITMYTYADIIEDSLVAFRIGLGKYAYYSYLVY